MILWYLQPRLMTLGDERAVLEATEMRLKFEEMNVPILQSSMMPVFLHCGLQVLTIIPSSSWRMYFWGSTHKSKVDIHMQGPNFRRVGDITQHAERNGTSFSQPYTGPIAH